MKKFLIPVLTVLMSFTMLFGSIGSIPVHAVDVQLTITPLSQTNMNTIQTWLKTNKPNWWSDYKYFIYFTTVWKVMLVPKTNTSAIIFGDNQVDTPYQEDIDQWRYQISCTTSAPCIVYQFNTNFSYNGTYNYTTNQDTIINFGVSYTNYSGATYLSYVVPPYQYTTVKTNLNLTNYGLYPFPSNWTETWGYTSTTTDQKQTDELINANWGMFNFLKDFLNWAFGIIFDLLESIGGAIWSVIPVDIQGVITYAWDLLSQIVPLILLVIGSLIDFVGLTISSIFGSTGILNSISGFTGSLNTVLNYLPTPFNSIGSALLIVLTASFIIQMTWFVVSLGLKNK